MSYVYEVNEANFMQEVIQSKLPVLVDFWAPWCGPCRMLGPILEQLSNEFKDKVKFVKINVDSNPGIAIQYNIQGIPAVFIFNKGALVGTPLVGVQPIDNYRATLSQFVSDDSTSQAPSIDEDERAIVDVKGKLEFVNQLKTQKLVLVDFWAPWCGPCRMLGPVLEMLAKDKQGQLKIIKVNVDDADNQYLAAEFGVTSIPQVTLMKNSQNIDQFIGALPYDSIKAMVEKYL